MYSIDQQKLKIYNSEHLAVEFEGHILKPEHTLEMRKPPLNEYDLQNLSTYNHHLVLISEVENPAGYDLEFSNRLARIQPLYKMEDFLEHHFVKTSDKTLFLKHLEYHILLFWADGKVSAREKFVRNWIDQKKKIHDNFLFKLTNEEKVKITLDLIGYAKVDDKGKTFDDHNSDTTVQPVYYYINDVLKQYDLTPSQGREIVLQMRGAVSPDWNKNVIPAVLEHLTLMTPLPNSSTQPVSVSLPAKKIVLKKKLPIKQIALIHVYEKRQVTRSNAGNIATEHGWTSGDKLYQQFTHFSSPANRKGHPGTVKKLKNQIQLFKAVEPQLSQTAKEMLNADLKALESEMEKEN